jgi:general secretion pathway protein D
MKFLPFFLSSANARHTTLCLAMAVMLPATQAQNTPPVKPGEPVTLNFVNADIEAVARTVATLSGANVVVDPRVKGTMSLSSTVPVPPAQALRLFAAQLRTQGFALVDNAGIQMVVPEADAKLQSGPVNAGNVNAGSGQVVTQIFKLNHEPAHNLVPVLRPLISPNNTINITPGSNAIVITDYADNLQRMGRIIAALDVASGTGLDVIRLQHGIASDMAPLLQRLIDGSGNPGPNAATPTTGTAQGLLHTTVMADARTNALIVRAANPAQLTLARSLAEQLDIPSATGANAASGNIHVVYLKNAEASKLAITLRAALAAEGRNNTSPQTGAAGTTSASPSSNTTASPATGSIAPSAQPSTGGQIQADPATNALIISAPEPQYRQLREVIDRLDQRRAQVMVESLIAEVNADKAAQMGIQWQNVLGNKGGNVGVLGTNFGTASTGNIVSLSTQGITATSGLSGGLNLGGFKYVNGTYVLAGLANFLEKNIGANVLSTPTLMTLDNEEARIVVGKNVSFQTGNTTVNSGGVSSPFQTFERKDVGLTLKIKPQISETGTVKLNVYQEVSDVIKVNGTDTVSDRAFSKRAIETHVLVEDGGIIVLGGLLSDNFSDEKNQVPGLGDIPLLGALFRNENRNRNKTNLMVFLRPVVLRDAEGTRAFSTSRYQEMIGLQQQAQPAANPLLNQINGSPVLAPLPAQPPASAQGAAQAN